MRLFEVNPHNYDSDVDYYDALRAKRKEPQEPDDVPEKRPFYTDKDAESDISLARQKSHSKFQEKRKVEWVNKEGDAPNGKQFNKLYVVDAVDEQTAAHEVYLFDKHEWGAKHIVDIRRSKGANPDLPVRYTMYIVDNHKHGNFTPFPGVQGKGGGSSIPPVQD
jgi:hypothetical protein